MKKILSSCLLVACLFGCNGGSDLAPEDSMESQLKAGTKAEPTTPKSGPAKADPSKK